MAKKSITDDLEKLRAEAEARFARDPRTRASIQPTSTLVHELQVHQIELEMQNEELRRNQAEIETAHERYVDLFDFAPVGYVTLDLGGLVTGANLTASGLLGRERTNLTGRPFARLVCGEDADRWHLFLSTLVRTDENRACRMVLTRGDGSTFVAHLACERRTNAADGAQIRIVLTDLTEVAQVEQALRETQERLSYVIDGSNDGFWDWDIPSARVKFSRRTGSLLGLDLDALESSVSTWDRLIHPDDSGSVKAAVEAHLQGESDQFAVEYRALHKDGRWIWVLDRGKVVKRGPDGKPMRMAGTYTDISARHEAESALQASEARFRELFHAVPALLWTIDPDGSVTDCNGAWCEFTGLTRAQSLGIGWMEALHPDDRATTRAAVTDALARGALYQVEQRLRRTDGEYRWFLTRGTPVRDATGRIVRWHGANVDISERKQAEAALQESERRFRALVDSAPVGVFLTDANGQSVYQNPVADEIMGMSIGQARGLGWQAAIAPEDRELLAREWQGAVKTGKTFRTEASLTMADGTRKRVEAHASPMHGPHGDFRGFIGVMINVTDQRALQEKVAQSARLAAMGTLVAGVAHEINNPLTALTACTGVALEDVRELQGMLRAGTAPDPDRLARRSQDVVEMLGDVEAGAARIARIVRDLTILGRPEQRRDRVRLADVMTGALKWLPDWVANRATIRTEVRAVPDVIASASQMELVLINLVTNAALSIPEGRTGEVVVRVLPGSASGVRIEVSDNGSGIAPELMKRIFEPFFTTRAQGTGTGLGLSICNAIVEAHGGTLTVQSEVGKGSTFRVGLPAASTEA